MPASPSFATTAPAPPTLPAVPACAPASAAATAAPPPPPPPAGRPAAALSRVAQLREDYLFALRAANASAIAERPFLASFPPDAASAHARDLLALRRPLEAVLAAAFERAFEAFVREARFEAHADALDRAAVHRRLREEVQVEGGLEEMRGSGPAEDLERARVEEKRLEVQRLEAMLEEMTSASEGLRREAMVFMNEYTALSDAIVKAMERAADGAKRLRSG